MHRLPAREAATPGCATVVGRGSSGARTAVPAAGATPAAPAGSMMRVALMALATMGASLPAAAQGQDCRCVPPMPCWNNVPWNALNTSVHGRLVKSVDELSVCLPKYGGSISSPECDAALNQTDNEFWLSNQTNGYQHTGVSLPLSLRLSGCSPSLSLSSACPGLFNEWNISDDFSGFSVRAETAEDFSATVKFASDHNLRLVALSLSLSLCLCLCMTRYDALSDSVGSQGHRARLVRPIHRRGLSTAVDAPPQGHQLPRQLRPGWL